MKSNGQRVLRWKVRRTIMRAHTKLRRRADDWCPRLCCLPGRAAISSEAARGCFPAFRRRLSGACEPRASLRAQQAPAFPPRGPDSFPRQRRPPNEHQSLSRAQIKRTRTRYPTRKQFQCVYGRLPKSRSPLVAPFPPSAANFMLLFGAGRFHVIMPGLHAQLIHYG